MMPRYLCTFDRIGRNHDVIPQQFIARDAQELADALYNFVRRHCASQEVEVVTDFDNSKGRVIVGGFRSAGDFTITLL